MHFSLFFYTIPHIQIKKSDLASDHESNRESDRDSDCESQYKEQTTSKGERSENFSHGLGVILGEGKKTYWFLLLKMSIRSGMLGS